MSAGSERSGAGSLPEPEIGLPEIWTPCRLIIPSPCANIRAPAALYKTWLLPPLQGPGLQAHYNRTLREEIRQREDCSIPRTLSAFVFRRGFPSSAVSDATDSRNLPEPRGILP